MPSINELIQRAGVVWRPCVGCGRDWPFPKGHHEIRDWVCAVCVHAEWARLERRKRKKR